MSKEINLEDLKIQDPPEVIRTLPAYWSCVQIKRLKDNAIIPTQGSVAAAGYDAYACLDHDVEILPGKNAKIGTGIAVSIPEVTWLGIFARSGLATKEGLRPANCVGVVDADYRGEIIVAIYNDSLEAKIIHPGDRIAQLILLPKFNWYIEEVEDLDDTDRGAGGFGSTGK